MALQPCQQSRRTRTCDSPSHDTSPAGNRRRTTDGQHCTEFPLLAHTLKESDHSVAAAGRTAGRSDENKSTAPPPLNVSHAPVDPAHYTGTERFRAGDRGRPGRRCLGRLPPTGGRAPGPGASERAVMRPRVPGSPHTHPGLSRTLFEDFLSRPQSVRRSDEDGRISRPRFTDESNDADPPTFWTRNNESRISCTTPGNR
jgi:hypothetical protein